MLVNIKMLAWEDKRRERLSLRFFNTEKCLCGMMVFSPCAYCKGGWENDIPRPSGPTVRQMIERIKDEAR